MYGSELSRNLHTGSQIQIHLMASHLGQRSATLPIHFFKIILETNGERIVSVLHISFGILGLSKQCNLHVCMRCIRCFIFLFLLLRCIIWNRLNLRNMHYKID